jgi:membrane-bound inhibitor of C-type lysozyme
VLSIKGALTYRERIAQPPDSVAIVELREASSAEGRVVAEQRIALAGRQVPIPFELSVDRAALAAGQAYAVRGAIRQSTGASWASASIAIDPAQPVIDLGMLDMVRVEPLAFASTLRCGDQSATVGMVGDTLTVVVDGMRYSLRQAVSASGARYEAVGDPTTTFWSEGDRATLVVKGRVYPECVRADAKPRPAP